MLKVKINIKGEYQYELSFFLYVNLYYPLPEKTNDIAS